MYYWKCFPLLLKKNILLFFLFFCSFFLFSTEESDVSILLKGPLEGKGLSFLSPNAISYFYGEYLYEDSVISVYYTDETLVPSSLWEKEVCGTLQVFRIPADNSTLLYYNENDRSAFFLFPAELEDNCRFIIKFLERLNYFLRIYSEDSETPFPAVLKF